MSVVRVRVDSSSQGKVVRQEEEYMLFFWEGHTDV